MSDSPLNNARLTVHIQPPGFCKGFSYEMQISPHVWADFLRPLPRDREVPWAPVAIEQARQLIKGRENLSRALAEQIAATIRKALSQQDPQFGYSPEDWEKLTRNK